MNLSDFKDALHSTKLKNWFVLNTDNLLAGRVFKRENEITDAIVSSIGNPKIVSQHQDCDIFDLTTNDIGEAAHNGTWQGAADGINHITLRFYQRLSQKHSKKYFALMYLMDVEDLDSEHIIPYSNAIPVNYFKNLQTKYKIENLLNKLPGKIKLHEPFHNLKSKQYSTILNYDIYVLEMDLDNNTANTIYNTFSNEDGCMTDAIKEVFFGFKPSKL